LNHKILSDHISSALSFLQRIRANEEKEILNEAEEELVSVEERASRLENQLKHGMLDSTDAAIKINMCLEVGRNLPISACSSHSQQCHIPSQPQSQQVVESTGAAFPQSLVPQTAYPKPSSWEWERLSRAYPEC
jgi:hypothetical protein